MSHPIDLLVDLVDGSLSLEDRAVVETHLASCPRCRDEVALAEAGRRALRGLEAPEVPAGLTDAALAEAERLAHGAAPEVTPLHRGGRAEAPAWYRWAGAAAAAAAVVLFVVVALPNVGDGDGDGVSSTQVERGADSVADVPVELEVQDVDYDDSLVQALALSYRDVSGSPAAEFSGATAAADVLPSGRIEAAGTAEALACLREAFPTLTDDPVRLVGARFDGTPAYLGVFLSGPGAGQPPDTVTVWVAARDDCSVLSSTQASL